MKKKIKSYECNFFASSKEKKRGKQTQQPISQFQSCCQNIWRQKFLL